MAEKWNKKWDGQPKPHLTVRERMQAAREAAEAKEREHERRLEEDAKYRAKWDKQQAKKAAKDQAKRTKKEEKKLAILRKHGVFDVVVPEGDDGQRHCPRCNRSEFTKRNLHGVEFQQSGGGPFSTLAQAAIGTPHMVCDHCGAAYPVSWVVYPWEL